MLYALVPFISFVNFAHLHLRRGRACGNRRSAYVALLLSGALAWCREPTAGCAWPRPRVGALIVQRRSSSTPATSGNAAGLGCARRRAGCSSAIAYDQLVSGPMFFIVGFAIGAIFGDRRRATRSARAVSAFVVRNPPLLAVIAGLLGLPRLIPNALVDRLAWRRAGAAPARLLRGRGQSRRPSGASEAARPVRPPGPRGGDRRRRCGCCRPAARAGRSCRRR